MHVFLTGATGFIGSYLLRELVARGHTARCLVRNPEDRLPVEDDRVEKVKGDVTEPRSLQGVLRGCEAVIHLVGILEEHPSKGITFKAVHYEGTVHVVDAAREAEIDRFIQMSSNGARPDGVSAYQTTKWQAEQYVKGAGFRHWTIFRPTVIFGDPGPEHPEFATRLARTLIKPFPVLPVFGDGTYRMQPVSIEEVVAAFVQALASEAASGQTYCAAGKEQYTFNEVLDIVTRGLGLEPKRKVPQPIWLVRPVIHAAGKTGVLPISPDQFEMLIEGNTCDSTAFYRDFEIAYKPFTPENLAYLKERV